MVHSNVKRTNNSNRPPRPPPISWRKFILQGLDATGSSILFRQKINLILNLTLFVSTFRQFRDLKLSYVRSHTHQHQHTTNSTDSDCSDWDRIPPWRQQTGSGILERFPLWQAYFIDGLRLFEVDPVHSDRWTHRGPSRRPLLVCCHLGGKSLESLRPSGHCTTVYNFAVRQTVRIYCQETKSHTSRDHSETTLPAMSYHMGKR